jgi:dCTP deaminase
VILTDREIRIHIERDWITVDPKPADTAYQSTAVDLTLDPVISLFKTPPPPTPGVDQITVIDPTNPAFKSDEAIRVLTELHTINPTVGYELKPHLLILAWTKEYIDLRQTQIAARVEGRSSLARLGISVHMTAPTIHAGFEGRIRLEIVNHGHYPVRLKPGMRICQLIFEQILGTPDKFYREAGQFAGQLPGA